MILPSPQGNVTYIHTGGALIYVIGRLQIVHVTWLAITHSVSIHDHLVRSHVVAIWNHCGP